MTPLEIVRQTAPIVNQAGNRFYFDADTMERGTELGLDGFRFYFLGRGGVLGDVDPAVIVAAFGYFSPGVVELMWDSAKQVVAPREAASEYLACADRFGIAKLDGIDVLDAFNDAAETVDRVGRPFGAPALRRDRGRATSRSSSRTRVPQRVHPARAARQRPSARDRRHRACRPWSLTRSGGPTTSRRSAGSRPRTSPTTTESDSTSSTS